MVEGTLEPYAFAFSDRNDIANANTDPNMDANADRDPFTISHDYNVTIDDAKPDRIALYYPDANGFAFTVSYAFFDPNADAVAESLSFTESDDCSAWNI